MSFYVDNLLHFPTLQILAFSLQSPSRAQHRGSFIKTVSIYRLLWLMTLVSVNLCRLTCKKGSFT